jgi:hypothetical protein
LALLRIYPDFVPVPVDSGRRTSANDIEHVLRSGFKLAQAALRTSLDRSTHGFSPGSHVLPPFRSKYLITPEAL